MVGAVGIVILWIISTAQMATRMYSQVSELLTGMLSTEFLSTGLRVGLDVQRP